MKKHVLLPIVLLLSTITLSSAQSISLKEPTSLFKENSEQTYVNAEGKTINECSEQLKTLSKSEETLLGEHCPFCNQGFFEAVKTSTGIALLDHDEKCTHHPFGSDFIYLTPKYTGYKCSYCGQGANTTTYLRRVECGGRSQ